jgi:threonine/homoserine/homoserine lactone efflux protein
MGIILFLKGLLIGFLASIPMGPIGVLCIQRTLNKGRQSGFYSGLGAAAGDTVYSIIAGFGISIIISFIEERHIYFQIIGGIIIVILGLNIFYTNPAKQLKVQRLNQSSLIEDFLSVFFLTITNPMPFFFFLAMFAGLNIAGNDPLDLLRIGIMVLGIFIGSTTWWFVLSTVVSFFRHRFRLRSLWWMNKIAGIITFFLGLAAILSVWLW